MCKPDVNGRALLAADRGELNKTLLDALEEFPNVKLFFNHKLTVSLKYSTKSNIEHLREIIIGRRLQT